MFDIENQTTTKQLNESIESFKNILDKINDYNQESIEIIDGDGNL